MKALVAFLIGMTAGVGVIRATEVASATQMRLMCFFLIGVIVGLVATATLRRRSAAWWPSPRAPPRRRSCSSRRTAPGAS